MTEKKVLEAELKLEKMSNNQEMQKREKEVTEYKRELELVKKELETEKQKPPTLQEVAFLMQILHLTAILCFVLLNVLMQGQVTETGSQSLETLSLQTFSKVGA